MTNFNFGSTSDGWRGVIAKEFTFENIEKLVNALAIYIAVNTLQKRVVIGKDTRFLSDEASKHMSHLFNERGIDTLLIEGYSTTPLVSFTANYTQSAFGFNVTASHNPPIYNGIKIRLEYGGTTTSEVISNIESKIDSIPRKTRILGSPKNIDPISSYRTRLRELIDIEAIARKQLKILIDPMFGSTQGLMAKLLDREEVIVDYMHEGVDPYFGGVNPEPKQESTLELQSRILNGDYSLGFAHDGDGDRIICCHPTYGYLSPHDISAILTLYLVKHKGLKGVVIGSSTLGRRTQMVCEQYGIPYKTMPVGFKNALPSMLKHEVMIAAEENGGIGFGMYLPERDATFAALLLLEAEAMVGINTLLEEILSLCGPSGFCRYNVTTTSNRKRLFSSLSQSRDIFETIKPIMKAEDEDGMKVTFKDKSWFSIRISGTEPILRVYCEADSYKDATALKDRIVDIIKEKDAS